MGTLSSETGNEKKTNSFWCERESSQLHEKECNISIFYNATKNCKSPHPQGRGFPVLKTATMVGASADRIDPPIA